MTDTASANTLIRFGPRRLGHANLWVGDVKRNTEFYNHVFGLHLECTEPGILGSFLGNGNTHHDIGTVEITRGEDRVGRDGQVLIPKSISANTGLFHLGWEMENEAQLVAAIARLRRTDQEITMFADHQISHSIYIPDPDGDLHEFYADAVVDWRPIFHGEMELITGLWDPEAQPPNEDPRYAPDPELYGVEGAPLRPLRIMHAGLTVSDLDKSVRWFVEVAGLDLSYRAEDDSFAILSGGIDRADLKLFQTEADEATGLHHVGFALESDAAVEQSKRDLAARDIPIEKEVDASGKHSLFILDPDGIRWEFGILRNPDPASVGDHPAAERRYLV